MAPEIKVVVSTRVFGFNVWAHGQWRAPIDCPSAISFGQIDRGSAATVITGADRMTSGGCTVSNGLSTLHATRPVGLPFPEGARGLPARLPTSAERSRYPT